MQSNLNWIHSEAYNHNDHLETLLPFSNKCISTNDIKKDAFWVFLPWSPSALRSFVSLSTSIWLCTENKSILFWNSLLKLQKKRCESFWSFELINIFNGGSNNILLLDNLNSNSKTLLDSITLTSKFDTTENINAFSFLQNSWKSAWRIMWCSHMNVPRVHALKM